MGHLIKEVKSSLPLRARQTIKPPGPRPILCIFFDFQALVVWLKPLERSRLLWHGAMLHLRL